jgi:hypothetical protein
LIVARRQSAFAGDRFPEGTRLAALTARHASIVYDNYLAPGRNAFRIVAPLTAERTAFQKNSRADSRSILEGILLNVKYSSAFHAPRQAFANAGAEENFAESSPAEKEEVR